MDVFEKAIQSQSQSPPKTPKLVGDIKPRRPLRVVAAVTPPKDEESGSFRDSLPNIASIAEDQPVAATPERSRTSFKTSSPIRKTSPTCDLSLSPVRHFPQSTVLQKSPSRGKDPDSSAHQQLSPNPEPNTFQHHSANLHSQMDAHRSTNRDSPMGEQQFGNRDISTLEQELTGGPPPTPTPTASRASHKRKRKFIFTSYHEHIVC